MANRIDEILGAIKSFRKETYYKDELLDEYFNLQQEIVNLTFNNDHAENSEFRLWHVEDHFEKMNESLGHPADNELASFKRDCKTVCNTIKAEYSGRMGENKAFNKLETLRTKHIIMKNVELSEQRQKTEIDAIVLTEKGIFVIEVKNPHKDIFIDENGDYYRNGKYQRLDCNLGEKMTLKNQLIKEAIKGAELKNHNIINIVVFTNNQIQVQNVSNCLRTCFLSMLPHIIDNYEGAVLYTEDDMARLSNALKEAELRKAYPPDIDIENFKRNFAILMTKLEEASNKASVCIESDDNCNIPSTDCCESINYAKNNSGLVNSGNVEKTPVKRKSLVIPAITSAAGFLLGIFLPSLIDNFKNK